MTAREYMAYSRQRSDNIKAIIAEHKQRKGMTDAMVAKAAGINPGTSFNENGIPNVPD